MREIEIVSFGMINALGAQLSEIDELLFTESHCRLQEDRQMLSEEQVCLLGKIVDELPALPQGFVHLDSRFARILFYLYQQIENSVQELKSVFGAERIGVVVGSSTSGIDMAEPAFIERAKLGAFPPWYSFFHQEVGSGSAFIAALGGIKGPAYTVSTACSSSAKVFKCAENLLDLDICDAVIVGGVDALCKLTVRGFDSLNLLSASQAQPMSKNRKGLNLGEGGALFTLIKSPFGVQLRGVGESSDAHHISSPHPQGRGAIAAMRSAVTDAEAALEDVRYINMHGTATQLNDSMESAAIAEVFGCEVPCSSTKPLTGHLLGASGAVEIGFCMLSLLRQGAQKPLLPHRWDGQRDEALAPIRLVEQGESVEVIPEKDLVLSNSFAFGGSNCCVALGLGETP